MIRRATNLKTLELRSDSPQQTLDLGARIGALLKGGDLVALDGPLGSGKTLFVRGMAHGLGVRGGAVSSPTFVICQEYEIPARNQLARAANALVHIDAYRLGSPDELETIGWSEILAARDAIIAVEWAERIGPALPGNRISIRFAHSGPGDRDTHRTVLITAAGDVIEALKGSGGEPSEPCACRICGTAFNRAAASFPFCSERCRLADLNQWFKGGYKMSRELKDDEELSE